MVDSDDEYEKDSRCMLPPPPKKPASFSVKKSSDYFQEKNPNRTHSTLSNKASRQQKNCNSVSLSSSLFNTTVICSDNTEFVQKKKPIESRTLNFDICNSTISNDMGMYIKKTLSLIIQNCHFYILFY